MRKEPLSKLKYLRNTYFCESYSLKVCNTCIIKYLRTPFLGSLNISNTFLEFLKDVVIQNF